MSREQLLRAPGCLELEAHLQEMLALPLGQLSQLREGMAFDDAAAASPNATASMSSFFLIATTFQGVLGESPLLLTVRGGAETGQFGILAPAPRFPAMRQERVARRFRRLFRILSGE
jgi:hypothetical protein